MGVVYYGSSSKTCVHGHVDGSKLKKELHRTQGELATSMTAFMATAMWHLGQVTLLDDAGLKGFTINPLVDPPEI